MGYMIEGGGSKTMSKAKEWLVNYPDDSKKLLELLTAVIVDYLEMQVHICLLYFTHIYFNLKKK